MPDEAFVIRYEFSSPSPAGGAPRVSAFTIRLDPKTLMNTAPAPAQIPDWARLATDKCPNCPLPDEGAATCPAALQLAEVVAGFADIVSHERVAVRVTVPERVYEQSDVAVQAALSSLLGVFMVTSGCPLLARMRPMVRFHLPFATELETITRTTSMYLLGQYLVAQEGGTPDWCLTKLAEDYRATALVNRAFARRLRAAAPRDANVNALTRLDLAVSSLPDLIEHQMDTLRFLFGK